MDGFAIVVQVLLATIALGSLFIKRWRERPQRPLLVWAMDTSKQALAASMVHFVNVFVSSISGIDAEGREGRSTNPCVWYFLNLGLDTTIGVGILYVFLKGCTPLPRHSRSRTWSRASTATHHGAWLLCFSLHLSASRSLNNRAILQRGHDRFGPWIKQLTLFITAWFFVKLSIVIALEVFPIFGILGVWILSPLAATGDPRLQVIVVMLVFPLIMNIIQAWLIDFVIKGKIGKARVRVGGNRGQQQQWVVQALVVVAAIWLDAETVAMAVKTRYRQSAQAVWGRMMWRRMPAMLASMTKGSMPATTMILSRHSWTTATPTLLILLELHQQDQHQQSTVDLSRPGYADGEGGRAVGILRIRTDGHDGLAGSLAQDTHSRP
ncbi:vacuolar membrane protein-domain-containing protein [Entophlyctis helioformis]|nr:vacuolar membrane protein-domain-containing protein [Entophlyctis helioformis]